MGQSTKRRLAMLAEGVLAATVVLAAVTGAAPPPAAMPQQPVAPPAQPAHATGKPNVLFLLIDDMGFADLSIMGDRKVQTPNLDRLAREGVLMTRFYDAAPICSASRAGFFTGRFPAEVGFVTYAAARASNAELGQVDWLDPKLPNVARMLKGEGYATAHVGKWHMGGGRDVGDAPWPTAYGFDESLTTFEGLGPRVLVSDLERPLADQSAALGEGPFFWRKKHELTPLYVDRSLDFIGRHKDKPWFVQLWLNDVHDPWGPDVDTLAQIKGKGADPDDDTYLATLVRMDRTIGEMVENLKDAGELDNTLIVITSDNGPSSLQRYYKNGHTAPGSVLNLRGRKWSNYEGGIRQPMIFYWPGHIRPGIRDDITVGEGVDLLPTLAAVVGAKVPAGVEGIDLSPVMQGRPVTQRPALFYAYGKAGAAKQPPQPTAPRDVAPPFAVRDGQWKLLMNADGGNAQLYDLDADPGEATNLAALQPQRRDQMMARLRAWMAKLPK